MDSRHRHRITGCITIALLLGPLPAFAERFGDFASVPGHPGAIALAMPAQHRTPNLVATVHGTLLTNATTNFRASMDGAGAEASAAADARREPPEADDSPLQTSAWLLVISLVALVVMGRRRGRDTDTQ